MDGASVLAMMPILICSRSGLSSVELERYPNIFR
jgi:hypothetical protein